MVNRRSRRSGRKSCPSWVFSLNKNVNYLGETYSTFYGVNLIALKKISSFCFGNDVLDHWRVQGGGGAPVNSLPL